MRTFAPTSSSRCALSAARAAPKRPRRAAAAHCLDSMGRHHTVLTLTARLEQCRAR